MTKGLALDFTPLDKLQANWFKPQHVLLIFTIIGLGFGLQISDLGGLAAVVYILGGLGLAGYLWVEYRQVELANQHVLEEFAARNNFKFWPAPKSKFFSMSIKLEGVSKQNTTIKLPFMPDMTDVARLGTLFSHGHSKRLKNFFSGQFHDLPFDLFNYVYETGSGKSRRTYDALVMELTLPRTLPHMVIDSVVEDIDASTLPIDFDNSQKIELEGDFHKYFDLYAPDKYGISALTILAPDAMQALLDHAALCDIEIIDNKLYFYWPLPARVRSQYENAFSTVDQVLHEIGGKLRHGDLFATASQAQVHSQPNAQGVRLKKSPWPVFLTVGAIAIYALGQLTSYLSTEWAWIFYTYFAVVVFVISVFIVVMAIRANRRRLREEYLAHYKSQK